MKILSAIFLVVFVPVSMPAGLIFLVLQKIAVLFEKVHLRSGFSVFRHSSRLFSLLAVPFIQIYYYSAFFWLGKLRNISLPAGTDAQTTDASDVFSSDKIETDEIKGFYSRQDGNTNVIQMELTNGEKITLTDVDPKTVEEFSRIKSIPFHKKTAVGE